MKRTKIPRASIQVGIIDDEDYIALTETDEGLAAFGFFCSLIVLARDMELNPLPVRVISRRLGKNQKQIKTFSKIIQRACFENENKPWVTLDDDENPKSVEVRNYAVWNKAETRGGARDGAGRKPKNNQNEIKSNSKSDASVTVTVTKEEKNSSEQARSLVGLNFKTKDGEWQLPADLYEKYIKAYPRVDVDEQLVIAYAWAESNPAKRKTNGGMPKFLNGWLARHNEKFQTEKKPERVKCPSCRGEYILSYREDPERGTVAVCCEQCEGGYVSK